MLRELSPNVVKLVHLIGETKLKKAEGGIISAIDKPKRPSKNFRGGGFIAAGCGQVQENRRKETRTF